MIKINERLKGKLDTYCEMVITGKPCAMLPVQKRYVVSALEIIQNYKLQGCSEPLSKNWITLWIYKKKFMIDIIKELPNKPTTTYDHWVLGKTFGYSDEAIEEYIKKREED